jgi:hypothetical protein
MNNKALQVHTIYVLKHSYWENHIGGVIVNILISSAVVHGSSPNHVKPKITKLLFVASPLSMQY